MCCSVLYVVNHALVLMKPNVAKARFISVPISLVLLRLCWSCQFAINFPCYLPSSASLHRRVPFFGAGYSGGWFFVLGLVCLITVDIIGYSSSRSPPTFLHYQIWCWEKCSHARREEAHSSEQEKLHNSAWAFFGGIACPITLGLLPGYCVIQLHVSLIARS